MAEELARKELLLRELVVHIAGRTGMLLELVNYNVEGASLSLGGLLGAGSGCRLTSTVTLSSDLQAP